MATKKELYEAVLQSSMSEEMKEVARSCLEGLQKLNANVTKSHKKKQTEKHAPIIEGLKGVLTDEKKTLTELCTALNTNGITTTTAVISAVLRNELAEEVESGITATASGSLNRTYWRK